MPYIGLALMGWEKFRQEHRQRGQRALCSIVKISILTELSGLAALVDDGLCQNLGIFLRLGLVSQVVRRLPGLSEYRLISIRRLSPSDLVGFRRSMMEIL